MTKKWIIASALVYAPLADGQGWVDINLYPYLSDVDSDTTMSAFAFKKLPGKFHYFGFVNYGSKSGNKGEWNKYYTEQNIRYKATQSFDLTVQSNFRTGDDNDRHRLGIRWRLNDTSGLSQFFSSINTKYAINWHAVQFDHEDADVWQLEHTWRTDFKCFGKGAYFSGFIDHTFNEDLAPGLPDSPIVAEAQFGLSIGKGWYAIAEYRINQYRRSDVNNMSAGVEYIFRF